jgi:hypothetical protein
MKTSIVLLTVLLAVITSEAAGQSAAQQPLSLPIGARNNVPARGSVDCDYYSCALRMKLSWGNWLILRGSDDRRVEKLGMFRTANVQSLVASSPEAVTEARVFERNYMPGEVWQAIGAIVLIAGAASADQDRSAVGPVAGVVSGSGLLFYGVFRSVRAINALHKSIWIYNGSLKR